MRTKLQSHGIVAGNRPLGPQVTSVDLFGRIRERFVVADIFVQSTSCNTEKRTGDASNLSLTILSKAFVERCGE